MTRRALVLLLAMLLAGGSCGGEDDARPATTGARAAVQGFFSAMVAQDGRAACRTLTARLRSRYGDPPDPCRREVLYAAVGTEPPRDVVVLRARGGGDAARVTVTTRRGHGGGERIERQAVRLVRDAGEWRIDGFADARG